MAMASRCAKQAAQNWQHRVLGSVNSNSNIRSMATTVTVDSNPLPNKEPPPTVETPKERTKILVLGGSGFVGSHVCMEALHRSLPVVSLNRSGRPEISNESWVNNVVWVRGDLFDPSRWQNSLEDVQAVISCVGGFGTNEQMKRINGEANKSAVWAATKAGVKRFVYISAADFGLPSFVLQGYYEGKRMAEETIRLKFPYSGVILRPGFIYGTRKVAGIDIPLGVIGSPLEKIMKQAKSASQIPVVGGLFVPPVNVVTVAKAAVRAAVDPVPPGVMDVWGIMRLGDH